MQNKINKKLLLALGILSILLLALLAYRSSYTKKPVWDVVFEKSSAAKQLEHASIETQSCKADEGSDTCDSGRRTMLDKAMDADFYHAGYQYCIKKFGKTAEDCKKLLDSVENNQSLNIMTPSKRE